MHQKDAIINMYLISVPLTPYIFVTFSKNSILLLGELAKWVPISPKRVTGLKVNDHDLEVTLKGAPGEVVDFHYYTDSLQVIPCIISPAGTAVISFARQKCFSV